MSTGSEDSAFEKASVWSITPECFEGARPDGLYSPGSMLKGAEGTAAASLP